jgi:hypothetical protein
MPTSTLNQRSSLPEVLLTTREAAQRYSWLTEGMLRKLRLEGKITCYEVGSLVFYDPADLEAIPRRVEARNPL